MSGRGPELSKPVDGLPNEFAVGQRHAFPGCLSEHWDAQSGRQGASIRQSRFHESNGACDSGLGSGCGHWPGGVMLDYLGAIEQQESTIFLQSFTSG